MSNYTATITVSVSAETAYTAIAQEMSDWWTSMSAKFLATGDRAKTDFGGKSFWTFEAITLDKPKAVELRSCEAYHIHDGLPEEIKEEWLDSILRFEIKDTKEGLKITLTHEGLMPNLICYDVCKAGWDHFFLGSLKKYLDQKST